MYSILNQINTNTNCQFAFSDWTFCSKSRLRHLKIGYERRPLTTTVAGAINHGDSSAWHGHCRFAVGTEAATTCRANETIRRNPPVKYSADWVINVSAIFGSASQDSSAARTIWAGFMNTAPKHSQTPETNPMEAAMIDRRVCNDTMIPSSVKEYFIDE